MAVSAVVTCGMIRDHPDMLRLVDLYCDGLTNFCMAAERDRDDDIMFWGGKEKCFAGQLRSVRFIISHSERGARTARREHVTHPGPADSLILILTAVVGWWQVSGGGALLGVLHSVQTWFRLFSWDTQPVLHSAGNMTGWDLNEWGTVRFKTQELHIDTAHCKMKPKCHKAGSMSSSSHSYIDLKLCLFGQTGLYELMI